MVVVALMLIPLVVFAAMGVDIASWHARVNQLQIAADAASTAGAVWMPNLTKAATVAEESLAMNGIADGQDDVTVTIGEGSSNTALRVEITDHSARRFLSAVMKGDQALTRSAEAEYFLPLPLGSPLNYFGGDATKSTRLITWPVPHDWPGTGVAGPFPCNVGTASTQGLGRWTTTGYSTGFIAGNPQCRWSAATTTTPVAPGDQQPMNVPCNARHVPAGALGRWDTAAADTVAPTFDPATRFTTGVGSRQCAWSIPSTLPPDSTTRAPANVPCNVSGDLATGRWVGAAYTAGAVTRDPDPNQHLCQWTPVMAAGTNPIAADRSPRLWAQVHGPGGNQQSGDAYATRCVTATNCATPDNALYVDPADPDQGYWYAITAPAGGGGPTEIRVFDASLTPGALDAGTGDSVISGTSMSFGTSFRVYEQTNPRDFHARVPVTGGAGDQNEGSCSWSLQQEAQFRLQWATLCTVDMQPGDTYLVNVRSAALAGVSNSAGRNSYAIEAVSAGGGPQPALYAHNKMVMYNNVDSGAATFYVAEVKQEYAGKMLVLELYDPGESSGEAWLYPMMPSATEVGASASPPTSACSFSSTRATYPRATDLNKSSVCSVRTSSAGALFNGHWVTIRVAIPETYTCTAGLDPQLEPGSCWWGIRYSFTAGTTDTTTWQARVEGNPVHLTG